MKLKRYKKMHDLGNGLVVISEKVKNDVNGNPRYDLDIFHNGFHLRAERVQSYNIKGEIEEVIGRVKEEFEIN